MSVEVANDSGLESSYSAFVRFVTAATMLAAGTLAATESAVAGVSKVYWTDRDNGTVSVIDLNGGASQILVQGFARLQDVDLDPSTSTLYFADWGPVGPPGGQGSINRVNPDGTGLATVLSTRDAVHQLALDPALQRIYFTRAVSYDEHEISHVTTGGAAYTVLLSGSFGGPGWFPSGLAVDPGNSLLYWGDIGVVFNPPNGSVNRMGTDGSAPTQLTPHVTGRGRGYALDPASQTIFLTAHNPQSPGAGGGVFSYDIANGTETQLVADLGTGYWDIEIDPGTQRIWWTDYRRGEIRSARFDGSDVQVELSNLSNPYGLALEVNAPPDCSSVSAGPDEIWPPNHQFEDVAVVGVTDPDGDPVTITIDTIAQDEPLDGLGDGNTCPDGDGIGTDTAVVRAERSGTKKTPGDGRVYHIGYTADDGQGGQCIGTVTVCVPHDQRPGHVCVDQGPLFDSTVCAP